nr:hypothetical protein [uncultured Amphritea sp.]
MHLKQPHNCNYQFSYLGGGSHGLGVDDIFKNINVYNLDDSNVALELLGIINKNELVERKNITSEMSRDESLSSIKLLTIDDLSTDELIELRELNAKDYQLIEKAKKLSKNGS